MAFSTKQNLSNQKFKQVSGSTLNLSGDTIIANSGSLNYQSAISISEPTEIVHKQYVDDSISNVTSLIITGATNGLTKTGKRVKLGGTLTGNTEIAGGGYYLNFGSASSKLSILSATTSNNQYFKSDSIIVSETISPFNFIVNTDTNAGRNVVTFNKRSSTGTPNVDNTGLIRFVLPTSTLVEKSAIDMIWRFSTTTNGNETSALEFRGYYTGSSSNRLLSFFNSYINIGHGSSGIGGFDVAIGTEARAHNAGQIALGYRAGKTSGAATGRIYAISIGYLANHGTYPIGNYSIAIGNAAITKSGDTISIGRSAGNTTGSFGNGAISIGANSNQGSSNIGANSIAIGTSTKAVGDGSIAIGESVQLVGSGSNIGIGSNAIAAGGTSIAIGQSAQANSGGESTAIGGSSRANTLSTTSVGFQAGNSTGSIGSRHTSYGAYANQGTHNIGIDSIGIGLYSKSIGHQSLAIGSFARSGADQVISIGNNAGNTTGTTNQYSINIGYRAGIGATGNPTIGENAISLGTKTSSSGSGSITIGNNTTNNTPNSVQFGWGANDDLKFIKGTIQTNNNTPTTLLSYTLDTGSTYSLQATILARQSDGSDRAMFIIKSLAYREGGGAVIEGTLPLDRIDSTNSNTWNVSINTNSNDVRIVVTGATSEIINWHVILQITKIS